MFGMIAKGDITDSSPNSVYAHFLLSSGPVFPKLHPLLASGVTESANYMKSPKTAIPDAAVSAYFVVDVVMECSTPSGTLTTLAALRKTRRLRQCSNSASFPAHSLQRKEPCVQY